MAKKVHKVQAQIQNEVQKPQSLTQAYLIIIWNWHPFLRNAVLLISGLIVFGYMIWSGLPDKIKTEILTSRGNSQSAPIETSNSLTSHSSNSSVSLIIPNSQLPPASNRPKQDVPAQKTRPMLGARNLEQSSIFNELLAKGLLEKMTQASNYAAAGNRDGQEKALLLFRSVVNQLSRDARRQLDQSLLNGADKDYRDGNTDEAVRKYRKLFSEYLGAGS
jgi:hypothetical protein